VAHPGLGQDGGIGTGDGRSPGGRTPEPPE
jgi:hypothetical protein